MPAYAFPRVRVTTSLRSSFQGLSFDLILLASMRSSDHNHHRHLVHSLARIAVNACFFGPDEASAVHRISRSWVEHYLQVASPQAPPIAGCCEPGVDSDQRKGTSRGARSQFDTSGSSNSVFFNCLKDLGLKQCQLSHSTSRAELNQLTLLAIVNFLQMIRIGPFLRYLINVIHHGFVVHVRAHTEVHFAFSTYSQQCALPSHSFIRPLEPSKDQRNSQDDISQYRSAAEVELTCRFDELCTTAGSYVWKDRTGRPVSLAWRWAAGTIGLPEVGWDCRTWDARWQCSGTLRSMSPCRRLNGWRGAASPAQLGLARLGERPAVRSRRPPICKKAYAAKMFGSHDVPDAAQQGTRSRPVEKRARGPFGD
ncbi:hypothetical protein L1887_49836 [Cichorium endivia]|nr:hypothetical protein L1887_49836 [Cichorium endivia]